MTAPQTQATKLQFQSPHTIAQPRRTVLYWGREKTGKTHCMASYPGVVVLFFDSNPDTLYKFNVPWLAIPPVPGMKPEDAINYWQYEVLPAIKARRLTELVRQQQGFEDYTVQTIALDSYTAMGRLLKDYLSGGGTSDMGYEGWGTYLAKMLQWTRDLCTVASPDPSTTAPRESYNFVASVHETTVLDDKGALVMIRPSLEGQFKDQLPQFFGTVLVCDSAAESQLIKGQEIRTASYFVHTIPPDRFRKAGDGVGGGRFGRLPAKLDGTYPSLAKAWGLPLDEPAK